ncbi:formamidopyrimidine-DNA glycosylase [soil metagenome]
MPEGLEVEIYRRAAEPLVGRTIARMVVDERIAGPGVLEASTAELIGAAVVGVRRIGKLLLVDTDGPTVGVHFGMTGRIVVDHIAPIGQLEYGSGRDRPEWDRLRIDLADGGSARVNDPRRWARVTLDPDTTALGPDLLALDLAELRGAVSGRFRPIKSVLLDQHLVAGLGNLCADEVLWHAGIAPTRIACHLTAHEIEALHDVITSRLPEMLLLGGSHRGTVSPELRAAMPVCPIDGAPLRRGRVAGRTTVWCGRHQA